MNIWEKLTRKGLKAQESEPEDKTKPGLVDEQGGGTRIGLAISGGGFRATLYALGSIWRLNDFGLLPRLHTITSVSGGSIISAYLAKNWGSLQFDENQVATNFKDVISNPIRDFCHQGMGASGIILRGLLCVRRNAGDELVRAYARQLFRDTTIGQISEQAPRFVFYGTSYQTGSSVRISKEAILDYKIGLYPQPEISLAKAVGISSAYPPFFSPVVVRTDPDRWVEGPYATCFQDPEYRKKLLLTDGGIYDNLGLEAIWKTENDSGKEKFTHVLCCDAGAPFQKAPKLSLNWWRQVRRVGDISIDQQRALRKRWLIENLINDVYGGTYFGISSLIKDYHFDDPMISENPLTDRLRDTPTTLDSLPADQCGHLINWGYALADTAVRKWVSELPAEKLLVKGEWPVPEYLLD